MFLCAAETSAQLTSLHPDYGLLAARIAVDNLHKNTSKTFSETAKILHNYVEPKTGLPAPLLSKEVFDVIMANADVLNSSIIYHRDFDYDYFGFKTLEVTEAGCNTVLSCYLSLPALTMGALFRSAGLPAQGGR